MFEAHGTIAREPTVEDLIARAAIQDVLLRYCRATDRGDFDLMRSVYHEGAVEEHGPYNGAAEGFIEFAETYLTEGCEWGRGFETSSHLLCNVLVELQSGRLAHVESYFMFAVRHEIKGQRKNAFIIGRFLDNFEKRKGQWGIAHRRVVLDQYFEIPVDVLDTELSTSFLRGHLGRRDPVYSWPARA